MAEPMWPAQVRVNPGQSRFDLIWFEATVQATHPFPPLFHQAGGAWGGAPGFMDSYTGRYERCMERKSMIQKTFFRQNPAQLIPQRVFYFASLAV